MCKQKENMQEAKVEEIAFLVKETEKGFIAKALDHSIYTEADTLEELKEMIKDAVRCHFDEEVRPKIIKLYNIKQEILD